MRRFFPAIALVLMLFGAGSPAFATPCYVAGRVQHVSAGKTLTPGHNEEGHPSMFNVVFTNITLEIDESEQCENTSITLKSQHEFGLCQDIDIVAGDYLRANAEKWLYSDACLSNITIVEHQQ